MGHSITGRNRPAVYGGGTTARQGLNGIVDVDGFKGESGETLKITIQVSRISDR